MIIAEANESLIRHVALGMREADFLEISAMGWADGREALADYVAKFHGITKSNSYVFGDRSDNPICVAGALAIRPGVWSVFMFATDDWHKIEKKGTIWAIKHFFPSLIACCAHRVECQSMVGHAKAHQWLEFFGFKQESLLKGYGRNGEDFVNYVWIPPTDPNARWQGAGIWR